MVYPQDRASWINLSCFYQGVLKPVIYEHLHVDRLKLFTLVEIYADGWLWGAQKTQDPLINTWYSSSRREHHRALSRTSEWSIRWALCTHRSQEPPVNITGREDKKKCCAHYMLERDRPNGSLQHEIKESSHKYRACAHTGHMTFVSRTFCFWW